MVFTPTGVPIEPMRFHPAETGILTDALMKPLIARGEVTLPGNFTQYPPPGMSESPE
jgi:hypothetical protein